MVYTLVFPSPYFRDLLRRLGESPKVEILCPVGLNFLEDEMQYLVRGIYDNHRETPHLHAHRYICISTTEQPLSEFSPAGEFKGLEPLGYLIIGLGEAKGMLWGVVTSPGYRSVSKLAEPVPFHRLLLVGPGMHELKLNHPKLGHKEITQLNQVTPTSFERWSRTIGALGPHTWWRLSSLRISVIGCGRTGSLIATTLVRLGVRHLTLIDPDIVEEHNLGEMDGVREEDLGKYKVEAVAEFLTNYCTASHISQKINAIPKSITSTGLSVKSADVLFCCVDDDSARLACGIIASLFHKVLIDVGTGIFQELTPHSDHPEDVSMGADIRLILPGECCLLCFGGLSHHDEAISQLLRRNISRQVADNHWWMGRAGSLRTLNMEAAGMAVQILCDLVAERIQSSTWIRVEYDSKANLMVRQIHFHREQNHPSCPLCLRAGMGDDGIDWTSLKER
jgi:hypothetical protein